MPLIIMLLAIVFNLFNASFNGYYLGFIEQARREAWLTDPRFIIGVILFISGALINNSADNYLIRIRRENKGEYTIPSGTLFRKISCPNFLGEMIDDVVLVNVRRHTDNFCTGPVQSQKG